MKPDQAPQRRARPRTPEAEPPSPTAIAMNGYLLPYRLLVHPISHQNALDRTYERLLMAIKFGFIATDDRLPPERDLTQQLGVSRSTIREALQALRVGGYVEARTGRRGGTFVIYEPRPTTKEEAARFVKRHRESLFDILDLRAAVEPALADLAAERAIEADIINLRTILAAEKESPKTRRRQIDVHFHLAIASMARAPSLAEAVLTVQFQLHEIIGFVPMLDVTMLKSERQHHTIAGAIAEGDSKGARNAMEDHVGVTSSVVRGFAGDLLNRSPVARRQIRTADQP